MVVSRYLLVLLSDTSVLCTWFMLGLISSLILSVLSACLLIFLLLPSPPPAPLPPSVPQRSLPSPATQIWAYLFSQSDNSGNQSCRLTVYRNWLKIEYPDLNIPEHSVQEEKIPKDLRFLTSHDQVDLHGARVRLPGDLPVSRSKFEYKDPVHLMPIIRKNLKSEYKFYSRSSREKEDLYRSLVDGVNYIQDGKNMKPYFPCQEIKSFMLSKFDSHMLQIKEGSLENCPVKEKELIMSEDISFAFLNVFLHRMFYDIKCEKVFLSIINKKLTDKLAKINFLRNFPHSRLGQIRPGSFPPFVKKVSTPYQDKKGLFLPVKISYSGISSVQFFIHEEKLSSPSQGDKIQRLLFGKISLRLDVLSLKGELCLNIPEEPIDRLWLGFSDVPDIKMNLVMMIGNKELQEVYPLFNLFISRLLLVLLNRIYKELKKTLVLPNINDISLRSIYTTKENSRFMNRKKSKVVSK